MLSHEDKIIQELRMHLIPVTANRVKVLSTAYQLQYCISTVTVQKAIGYTIERTSIHRALRLFCKKGVLLPVPNTNGLIEYEVTVKTANSNAQKKATFICLQCGQLHELTLQGKLLNDEKKIRVEKVIIEGLCEQCGV